jgi:hypothetical protein
MLVVVLRDVLAGRVVKKVVVDNPPALLFVLVTVVTFGGIISVLTTVRVMRTGGKSTNTVEVDTICDGTVTHSVNVVGTVSVTLMDSYSTVVRVNVVVTGGKTVSTTRVVGVPSNVTMTVSLTVSCGMVVVSVTS